MSDLNRFERELLGGRPDVVWRWGVEARRRGLLDDASAWYGVLERVRDARGAMLAPMLVALDDWPRVGRWLSGLWLDDARRADEVLAWLGIVTEATTHDRLTAAIRQANGALVSCELTPGHVLEAILRARLDPRLPGLAWVHGGMTRFVFKTVLALAVVEPTSAALVVAVGKVNGDPSPDRLWPELGPWDDEAPERNAEAARDWARDLGDGGVRFGLVELPIDARCLLETMSASRPGHARRG